MRIALPRLRAIRPLAPQWDSVSRKTGADTETALLTDHLRKELARIAKPLQLPARAVIYREDARAHSVFAVLEGVVKSYRELPSGKRMISAFLFPGDLFGLAESGRYLNCAQAITRVTLHQLPLEKLIPLVKRDPELQFQFLSKVTHELRESHRRSTLIARRDAAGRLASFLLMMRRHRQTTRSDREVMLPMSRTDIADFLGLSREAVSRAAGLLQRRGIVAFEGRHLARIVDTGLLAKLAATV
jgi:CRP-like cAMP-binding protein